jgi:hypothetical protein
MAVPYQIGSS